MAYTFTSFVNTIEEEKIGTNDFTLFQSWVNSERTALETALAGMENMANFTYSSSSESLL